MSLRGCGCIACRLRATSWWRRKLWRVTGSERWLAPKPGIAGVSKASHD